MYTRPRGENRHSKSKHPVKLQIFSWPYEFFVKSCKSARISTKAYFLIFRVLLSKRGYSIGGSPSGTSNHDITQFFFYNHDHVNQPKNWIIMLSSKTSPNHASRLKYFSNHDHVWTSDYAITTKKIPNHVITKEKRPYHDITQTARGPLQGKETPS